MIPFVSCPELQALAGIRHGFFTRRGGVSKGLFASLNCAYGTGDEAADVAENIRRVTEALGADEKHFCKAHQVHGTHVVIAENGWHREEAPQADAIVTATPGLALGITTADCLPILLADAKARVVAAAHAGWRPAFGGIIEATISAMQSLGADKAQIVAGIGPGIAQGSYEVDAAFHERFLQQDEHHCQYFVHGARDGHYLFDLKAYAKDRLRDAGVEKVNLLAPDTCLQEDDFFSYRRATLRGEPSYGCQLSAIMLA